METTFSNVEILAAQDEFEQSGKNWLIQQLKHDIVGEATGIKRK